MGKSSIHVKGVSAGSESHNQRQKKLDYVREDLTPLNSSWIDERIEEARRRIEESYTSSKGQKIQAKSKPIREGVLLIESHHTAQDLRRVATAIEDRFGIRTIQAYCHKDEGHQDKVTGEWKPNYHAHMVFDWTQKGTGKNIRLKRDDMSELQDIVARELDLERGQKSSVKHLNALAYKSKKQVEEIIKTHKLERGLIEATEIVEDIERHRKELESLTGQKKSLSEHTELLQANLAYVEEKNRQKEKELQELNKKLEEKKTYGFKR